MIDDQPVIALVPARGGSKGFPGKNLALLEHRSLIEWTVSEAKKSAYIDRVVLSTDCEKIAAEGRRHGAEVPFIRPSHLATDTATSAAVAVHALDALGVESGLLVLLQPTSPLRSVNDIDQCIRSAVRCESGVCVSISEVEKSPYWMFRRHDDGRLFPLMPEALRPNRRQDAPVVYALNGAVYALRIERFLATASFAVEGAHGYIMPAERSVDIDRSEDLAMAAWILARSKTPRE